MLDNQLSRFRMAREALVNGGCNLDGPKVAKSCPCVKFHTLANHCMLGNLLRLKYLNGDNLENKRQSAGNQPSSGIGTPKRATL